MVSDLVPHLLCDQSLPWLNWAPAIQQRGGAKDRGGEAKERSKEAKTHIAGKRIHRAAIARVERVECHMELEARCAQRARPRLLE